VQKKPTMKQRLYIETSVVSYLAARPSRDLLIAARQEATAELWSKLLSSGFTGYRCPEVCSPEELLEISL
jgi:hypothetical protein